MNYLWPRPKPKPRSCKVVVTVVNPGAVTQVRVVSWDTPGNVWYGVPSGPNRYTVTITDNFLTGSWFEVTSTDRQLVQERFVIPDRNVEYHHPDVVLRLAYVIRDGNVHHDGKAWVDNQGRWRPWGQTLFYPIDRLERGEEADLRATYAWLASFGVDMQRSLGQVFWPQTAFPPFIDGHAIRIAPADANYPSLLAAAIDIPYEYGIRTALPIYGEPPSTTDPAGWTPEKTAERIADVISSRLHKIHSISMTNEGKLDEATMFRMGDILKPLGIPLAPTCPPNMEQGIRWIESGHGFTHSIPRLDRSNGDRDWRFPRQVSDYRNQRYAGDHEEPQGPASSLAATYDPLRLAVQRLVAISCGFESWVLHNAAGVNGFEDPSRNRTAKLWDMPAIDQTMQLLKWAGKAMPDVIGWTTTSQSGTSPRNGQVLTSDAIWSDGQDHGCSRNYGNNGPNGEFVQIPFGILDRLRLVANTACDGEIINIGTQEVHPFSLQAGQAVEVPGDPQTNTAYLVQGQQR